MSKLATVPTYEVIPIDQIKRRKTDIKMKYKSSMLTSPPGGSFLTVSPLRTGREGDTDSNTSANYVK